MITVSAAPLPSNFRGTPQELIEAFLDRLEITSDDTTFVISDVEPIGNQGPWLKNGTQWWVWDENTSAYIPLDISASFDEQIFVGVAEPDTEDFQIWLKISNTNTVLGLFYWFGDEVGWVAQEVGVTPNSVGEDELQDDAVTRNKIRNGEVVAAKIQNDLPLSKLIRGTSRQFLRMNVSASSLIYETFIQESAEIAITYEALLEAEHTLGITPNWVRAVLVCKETDRGFEVDDEVDLEGNNGSTITHYQNATVMGVIIRNPFEVRRKDTPASGNIAITAAKWKLKFYYARG